MKRPNQNDRVLVGVALDDKRLVSNRGGAVIRKANQNDYVLEYLKQHKTITCAEAVSQLNIYRLSARIYDLRELGYWIDSVWRKSLSGKRYVEYTLMRKRPLKGGAA